MIALHKDTVESEYNNNMCLILEKEVIVKDKTLRFNGAMANAVRNRRH